MLCRGVLDFGFRNLVRGSLHKVRDNGRWRYICIKFGFRRVYGSLFFVVVVEFLVHLVYLLIRALIWKSRKGTIIISQILGGLLRVDVLI